MNDCILVSRCLLGDNCRYDGGHNRSEAVLAFLRDKQYFPFCPEMAGGLAAPREPTERQDGRVLARDGRDVTAFFEAGAQAALLHAQTLNATLWLGKENSPSCGVHTVRDGSFAKRSVPGQGVTTELLTSFGLQAVSEHDIERLMVPPEK